MIKETGSVWLIVKLVVVKSTIQDPGLATRLRQFCKYVIWVASYLINKRHDRGTLNSLHHSQTIHPIENFISINLLQMSFMIT